MANISIVIYPIPNVCLCVCDSEWIVSRRLDEQQTMINCTHEDRKLLPGSFGCGIRKFCALARRLWLSTMRPAGRLFGHKQSLVSLARFVCPCIYGGKNNHSYDNYVCVRTIAMCVCLSVYQHKHACAHIFTIHYCLLCGALNVSCGKYLRPVQVDVERETVMVVVIE